MAEQVCSLSSDFVENEGWCVYDLWVELVRVIYSVVYADVANVAIECGFDHISGVLRRFLSNSSCSERLLFLDRGEMCCDFFRMSLARRFCMVFPGVGKGISSIVNSSASAILGRCSGESRCVL
jgi:hypothetical protein